MKRRWRAVALLAALAGMLVLLHVGWNYAQDRIARWMGVEHSMAGWKWRLFGVRRTGWSLLEIDSATASSATVSLKLRIARIALEGRAVPYLLPLSLTVHGRSLEVSTRPNPVKDTSAPRFPAAIRFPLRLEAGLDSFRLVSAGGRDPGRQILSIQGIRVASVSPFGADVAARRIEPGSLAMHVGVGAFVDWRSGDTLRVRLAALAATGCCQQDSLRLDAALSRSDLRRGRARLAADIESTRGWGEIVPALAKAPGLHRITLDARGRSDGDRRDLDLDLGFDADSIAFFPKMRYRIAAGLDADRIQLDIDARDEKESGLHAKLSAPVPRSGPLSNAVASGEIRIDGLGWTLQGFDHPLDGTILVDALDRKGASVQVRTDAGSRIVADAAWKGLRWNLAGRIAPQEPWAVGWVNGLSMEQTGSVYGHDSAGGAFFAVTARQPRMTAVVALDSLSTNLWIGPGPHLVFTGIEARDSGNTWLGTGDIAIRDSLIRFELRPQSDSIGSANLEVRLGGGVVIAANSFPTKGLPLRLPFALPFEGRVDGGLRRDAPPPGGKSISRVEATLRAKPRRDSVRLGVELAIGDGSVRLPRIQLDVAGSRLSGSLATSAGADGWGLDTLRLRTDSFDLSRAAGLWPGVPSLKGMLRGHFLSQRGTAITAHAKLESAEITGSDKPFLLPDLVLWSERDTVHLGGWVPLNGSRSPFHLAATRLWDSTPAFSLKAFYGDVVKLEADGTFKNKKELETSFRVTGSGWIPGTEARLQDILVSGRVDGRRGADGFVWNAKARGERGVLTALAGNPLDLRFDISADAKEVKVERLSLSGARNGRFEAEGAWNIPRKALAMTGHAGKFRLDLGPDKWLALDSLGIRATPDSRIRLVARNVFWHQAFEEKGERLDLGVSQANLTLVQAKDWKKLSGDVTVDKLLFTRNFAQVGDLLQTVAGMGKKKKRYAGSSAGIPLLLDVQATSDGDNIRIANNLGQANLGFDLQVTGPTESPLLNGFVAAYSDSGRFGYLGRNFTLDTLRVDWNTEPPLKGAFSLAGSRQVRQTCEDPQATGTLPADVEYCSLILSSQGTLEDPRLRGLSTRDCAQDPSDDGTVGAFVALATDCYPQPGSQNNARWGSVVKDGTIDLAYGYGMGWFNQVLMERLRGSRQDAIWLPDSVMLTDFPVGGVRDQLGLSALYHITPEFDIAAVYRHTFTQAGTSTSGSPVLADDYGVSLKYRIPFWWVEEERVRKRLTNRVFLQADFNQGLDERSRRTFSVLPSLRYRWEFW